MEFVFVCCSAHGVCLLFVIQLTVMNAGRKYLGLGDLRGKVGDFYLYLHLCIVGHVNI